MYCSLLLFQVNIFFCDLNFLYGCLFSRFEVPANKVHVPFPLIKLTFLLPEPCFSDKVNFWLTILFSSHKFYFCWPNYFCQTSFIFSVQTMFSSYISKKVSSSSSRFSILLLLLFFDLGTIYRQLGDHSGTMDPGPGEGLRI